MGIIGWIVIGALAGWIASIITKNSRKMGAGANILVGVVGGFLGGLIMNLLGNEGITGFNVWSLLVATGGAILLLLIVNAFKSGVKAN
ncbi:MAG: GlsB/YeaQ/YmgE family stress response membrane protein [Clostridiales bacterium]|nr:GlsB/YeaQ/YmgE family stress response membrane protein [Clostridiales bacterium]